MFYRSFKNQVGAAFVETVIILPVLLILTVGLINIGSLLWQITIASDAVRHGARAAARSSMESRMQPCTDIINQANQSTQDYMLNTLKIPQHVWEFGPWPSGNPGAQTCEITPPEATVNTAILVRQKIQMKDTVNGTCLFCFGGIVQKILPAASISFLLPGACCNYNANLGACVSLPSCD
jgi:Flp pilus assembly protein TadG